jgi:hypothetical protein
MIHVVGSISWNSTGWTGRPTEADQARSRFGNVRDGYFGNESWNLDRSNFVWDDHKYGAVEKIERSRRFSSGEGIVFFWSQKPQSSPVLVGLYARCEVLPGYVTLARKWEDGKGRHGEPEFNLRVPTEPSWLIQSFEHHLAANPDRYLRDVDKWKKRPGQISWCYIDDWSAANIVNDAIAAGNEGVRAVKDAYGF